MSIQLTFSVDLHEKEKVFPIDNVCSVNTQRSTMTVVEQ